MEDSCGHDHAVTMERLIDAGLILDSEGQGDFFNKMAHRVHRNR